MTTRVAMITGTSMKTVTAALVVVLALCLTPLRAQVDDSFGSRQELAVAG